MSITTLLAESYAGIPKSEYLKRLQGALQLTSHVAQATEATSAANSNSAVTLDLSPEAQRFMAGELGIQEPPPLPADIKENVGTFAKEISQLIGFEIDVNSSQQIYMVNGQKTTVERSAIKYFYEHPEKATDFMNKAQMLQSEIRKYPGGHNTENSQQRENMLGLLDSITHAAKYSMRDLGLMAKDMNKPVEFAEDSQPSKEAVQQGVLSYMETKYGIALDESFHDQLQIGGTRLQSINGVEIRSYTDGGIEQALNALTEVKNYYDGLNANKGNFMKVAGVNLPIIQSSIMDQKPISLASLDVEEGIATMASMISSQVADSRARVQETLTILARNAQHDGRMNTINQVMKHYLPDTVPDFELSRFLGS